jgi:thymidylate kinase
MAPDEGQLEQIAARAKGILPQLLEDDGPLVVEFAGSPKAGKSTSIDILAHFFKRMGFKVWAPTEGASKRTPYHLRRDLVAFNTWTLNYAVSELLVAYHNVDRPHLVVLDRGPYDSLAWMGLLKDREELKEDEFSVFKRFATLPRWADLIGRLYLFRCDPDVSLEREHASKLTRLPGTAMNLEMLKALLEKYDKLSANVPPRRLKEVKTTRETTPFATSFELAEDLIALLEKRTQHTRQE